MRPSVPPCSMSAGLSLFQGNDGGTTEGAGTGAGTAGGGATGGGGGGGGSANANPAGSAASSASESAAPHDLFTVHESFTIRDRGQGVPRIILRPSAGQQSNGVPGEAPPRGTRFPRA